LEGLQRIRACLSGADWNPLSFSIADGLEFISYPIIKLFSGRGREVGWLTYMLGAVLAAYFLLVRSRIWDNSTGELPE
jgi:hypothetical protein